MAADVGTWGDRKNTPPRILASEVDGGAAEKASLRRVIPDSITRISSKLSILVEQY